MKAARMLRSLRFCAAPRCSRCSPFRSLSLSGCYYAEMRDDEAVQAYNQEFPQMPKKTIPVDGGIWIEREANPMELINPLPNDPRTVAWERKGIGSIASNVTVPSWTATARSDKVSHPFPQT